MNCNHIQENLSQYLDDRLDDEKRGEIEDHLAACSRCLPEAKLLSDGIKGISALPEIEPPAGFSQRVMARIRSEKEKPTLWNRLFQPLWIKIPLHATGVLLAVGLGVYLFSLNEPIQMKIAEPVPSEPAPSLKQAPANEVKTAEPRKGEGAPMTAAPSAGAPGPFADSDQGPAPTSRIDPFEKAGPAASAERDRPMPAQERRSEAEPVPEALSQRKSAAPEQGVPDIVLTLRPNEPAETTAALTTRIKQAAERSRGKVFALVKEPDPKGVNLNFWLNLPSSEYDPFKKELSRLGSVLSESTPAGAPSRPRSESPSPIQVKVTFLFEDPKEIAAPPASAPPQK